MIHYKCPCCDNALKSEDDMGGKEEDCPKCEAHFILPDLSSFKQYKCVDCKSKIHVELGACWRCGAAIQLPVLYQLMTGLGGVTGFVCMFLYYFWLGSFLGILTLFIGTAYMIAMLSLLVSHSVIGIKGKRVLQYFLVAHLLLTVVFFSLPAYWSEITTATWIFAGLIPVLVFATVFGYARNSRVIACFSPLKPKVLSDGVDPYILEMQRLDAALDALSVGKPETNDEPHESNQTHEVHDKQDFLITEPVVKAGSKVEQLLGEDFSAKRVAILDTGTAQTKTAHNAKKSDSVNLSDVLRANGCDYLYHFTDEANIESIRRYGIYSRHQLQRRDINHVTGGDDTSLAMDQQKGLDQYVHLSLTDKHPMAYYAEQREGHGRILHLRIAPEVIDIEEVRGTVSVATSSNAQLESMGEFFDNIDWDILSEYLTGYQVDMHKGSPFNMMCKAEILVPNYIPPSMIIDL